MVVDGLARRVPRSWHTRTWKREVSCLLLVVWAIITVRLFCFPASETFLAAVVGLYGIVTPAVFTFAIGAFGFDAYVKQMLGQTDGTTPRPAASPPPIPGVRGAGP